MSLRTLGLFAGIGVMATFSAQAQEPVGDIVDQILNPKTATSPDVAPPAPPPPVMPAASQPLPPPPPVAITPVPPPTPLAPLPAASAVPLSPAPPKAVAAPAAAVPMSPAPTASSVDIAGSTQPSLVSVTSTPRWSGFFVGANFGGGTASGGSGQTCTNSTTGTTSGCDIIPGGGLSTSGVLGGGQFGFLKQFQVGWTAPLVVGGEVDFDGTGINGSQTVSGPFSLSGFPALFCSPCSYTARQSLTSLTTLRARIGVPINDDVLLYGTGGVAIGGASVSQNLSFIGSSEGDVVSKKTILTGPVVGAGVEFAAYGPWTARIEGLYYDLGTVNTTALPVGGAPSNFTESKRFGFRGGIVRLGINLKLGDLPN
jgi:outer membrane immunogenic protein